MKECASGNAIVVHRNVRSDALLMYTSTELPTSGADLFGIGYGRGALTLIVRYDTRVRVVASYGCTIKLGLDEATVTGGHFFSGGTKIDIMPDCGPGSWVCLRHGPCLKTPCSPTCLLPVRRSTSLQRTGASSQVARSG